MVLGWAALAALPLGMLAARVSLGIFAWMPLGLWCVALAWSLVLSPRLVPTPLYAGFVVAGLYAAGHGLVRGWRVGSRAVEGGFVLCVFLCLAPASSGWLGRAWDPALASRLLDLSPWSLVFEAAGIDWMRHAAMYEPAGALDIDPSLRQPYTPALAGTLALVLGCALALGGELRARRKHPV